MDYGDTAEPDTLSGVDVGRILLPRNAQKKRERKTGALFLLLYVKWSELSLPFGWRLLVFNSHLHAIFLFLMKKELTDL